jgi:hypothetical protein
MYTVNPVGKFTYSLIINYLLTLSQYEALFVKVIVKDKLSGLYKVCFFLL